MFLKFNEQYSLVPAVITGVMIFWIGSFTALNLVCHYVPSYDTFGMGIFEVAFTCVATPLCTLLISVFAVVKINRFAATYMP